jgi:hypothetical protein
MAQFVKPGRFTRGPFIQSSGKSWHTPTEAVWFERQRCKAANFEESRNTTDRPGMMHSGDAYDVSDVIRKERDN